MDALLNDNHPGAESKLNERQMRELNATLQKQIMPDAKAVIAPIQKRNRFR